MKVTGPLAAIRPRSPGPPLHPTDCGGASRCAVGKPVGLRHFRNTRVGAVGRCVCVGRRNYPTSPRPPFGKATDNDTIAVEGHREWPFEVDSDLTVVQSPTGIIKNPAGVSLVINQNSTDAARSAPPPLIEASYAGTGLSLCSAILRAAC